MNTYVLTAHTSVRHIQRSLNMHALGTHQKLFRKIIIHPSSGTFGYSRLLYNELVPLELEERGKAIKSENSNAVVVTLQSENTPHLKKKTKAATPQKVFR